MIHTHMQTAIESLINIHAWNLNYLSQKLDKSSCVYKYSK